MSSSGGQSVITECILLARQERFQLENIKPAITMLDG